MSCYRPNWLSEDDRINASIAALRQKLDDLNRSMYDDTQGHLMAAVNNVIANARWRFVDEHGPKTGRVSHTEDKEEPVMWKLVKHIKVCW